MIHIYVPILTLSLFYIDMVLLCTMKVTFVPRWLICVRKRAPTASGMQLSAVRCLKVKINLRPLYATLYACRIYIAVYTGIFIWRSRISIELLNTFWQNASKIDCCMFVDLDRHSRKRCFTCKFNASFSIRPCVYVRRSNGIGIWIREWPWQIPTSAKYVLELLTVSRVRRKTQYFFLREKNVSTLPMHIILSSAWLRLVKASSSTSYKVVFESRSMMCTRSFGLAFAYYSILLLTNNKLISFNNVHTHAHMIGWTV